MEVVGSDAGAKPLYLSGGSFNGAADQTDQLGQAVFLNVPVGPVTVGQTPLAVGHMTSVATVFVRAGAITGIALRPNQ
jgi:hypothetical protein